MNIDLPTLSQQKRKVYKINYKEFHYTYDVLNEEIFNNKLYKPKLVIKKRLYNIWGACSANGYSVKHKTNCKITLTQNWFCKQWFIMVLAHEMCHQYQWDVVGVKRLSEGKFPVMSHGHSFYKFKNKLNKHGIPLKRVLHSAIWFKKQNLMKC